MAFDTTSKRETKARSKVEGGKGYQDRPGRKGCKEENVLEMFSMWKNLLNIRKRPSCVQRRGGHVESIYKKGGGIKVGLTNE
jgi:hypothetical protein